MWWCPESWLSLSSSHHPTHSPGPHFSPLGASVPVPAGPVSSLLQSCPAWSWAKPSLSVDSHPSTASVCPCLQGDARCLGLSQCPLTPLLLAGLMGWVPADRLCLICSTGSPVAPYHPFAPNLSTLTVSFCHVQAWTLSTMEPDPQLFRALSLWHLLKDYTGTGFWASPPPSADSLTNNRNLSGLQNSSWAMW